MGYVSLPYYALVIVLVLFYYILPRDFRWLVLLLGSGYFYYSLIDDVTTLAIFGSCIFFAYAFGRIIYQQYHNRRLHPFIKRITLWTGIILSSFPLIISRCVELFEVEREDISLLIPVGVSFYTMEMISYLVDIYRGEYRTEKSLLRFALYISFFPLVIQGPISRFEQMHPQLMEGNDFAFDNIVRGMQSILWGFFLKYMIADKAAVVVNAVFDNYAEYTGFYVLLGAVLYSIQLYTDFQSCVSISQGVAQLFGIEVMDNFNHPYFAASIRDFWRRWHISLSFWLRDYVYIPLGGNRKGTGRKYVNLAITFFVSGLWHGGSVKYIFWGLLHASYQMFGGVFENVKKRVLQVTGLSQNSYPQKIAEAVVTDFLVMVAWIIFRAEDLGAGLKMIRSMFGVFNPWVLFSDAFLQIGLNQKEWHILTVSIVLLGIISALQEKGISIRGWINRQTLAVRWAIYFCCIWSIWLFGTYGFGFDARDFIYGGF